MSAYRIQHKSIGYSKVASLVREIKRGFDVDSGHIETITPPSMDIHLLRLLVMTL